MMAPEAAPEAPAAAEAKPAAAAEAKAAPLAQMERDEAPPPSGWSRVRRVRELYVGPMSWIAAMCVLGPLVLLCPCDGRDVWMGDCCGDGCVMDTHEDDEFDQSGTQLRPLKRDAPSRPRIVTDDGSWPPPAAEAAESQGAPSAPLARQRSLGVTA